MILSMPTFTSTQTQPSAAVASSVNVLFFDQEGQIIQQPEWMNDDEKQALERHCAALNLEKQELLTLPIAEHGYALSVLWDNKKIATIHQQQKLGTRIALMLKHLNEGTLAVHWPASSLDVIAQVIHGMYSAGYTFDHYKTVKKEDASNHDWQLAHIHKDCQTLAELDQRIHCVVDGQNFAKDLMHEPPNRLTPSAFAERIAELRSLGLEVEIFDEEKLKAERMHALLAVGQGSQQPSRFACIRWCGASKDCQDPVALVGKGVCFDSGGINIKLAQLIDMKYDMGGAAAVVGAMHTIASLKCPVNVVGLVALVENMPSGHAYRPSDIIDSRAGHTIEVLNTDAEGRLILADAIDYATDLKPRAIIDLATLTGAVLVGLGHEYAGLFANDDQLLADIQYASKQSGQKVWQLPLDPVYDQLMDSPIADIQNINLAGKAGSITAAQFLQRFTKSIPWAHIDIAGTAWIPSGDGVHAKGPTGYGVSLLVNLVEKHG